MAHFISLAILVGVIVLMGFAPSPTHKITPATQEAIESSTFTIIPTQTDTKQETKSSPNSGGAKPIGNSVTPTTVIPQTESAEMKIAKCKAVYDIKVSNIESEIDKQFAISLNNLGLLKKVEDYKLEIKNLEVQRQELLRKQLLSPPWSPGDENILTPEQQLSLMREKGKEYEPLIQSIEQQIFQRKNYLLYLNDAVAKLRPEMVNEIKGIYLNEYSKCLDN